MSDPTLPRTVRTPPAQAPGQQAGWPAEPGPAPGPEPGSDGDTIWILRLARVIVLFVYGVVSACLVLLALGFVLRLFGASTDADFTEWVYRSVDRIMEPFRGMFPTEQLGDRSVVDFSLLFAMIVYGIAAVALHALVSWLARQVVIATGRRDAPGRRQPGPFPR